MVHNSGWYMEKANSEQNKMYSFLDCVKCYGTKTKARKGDRDINEGWVDFTENDQGRVREVICGQMYGFKRHFRNFAVSKTRNI